MGRSMTLRRHVNIKQERYEMLRVLAYLETKQSDHLARYGRLREP
jgi:hypothetical protein